MLMTTVHHWWCLNNSVFSGVWTLTMNETISVARCRSYLLIAIGQTITAHLSTIVSYFHDKNINRTQQSCWKVRITGTTQSNRARLSYELKGTWCKPYCSILLGVFHKPQYVWMAGCAWSTSWKQRGTGCSPDMAGRHTCARIGLISWHGRRESRRKRGRETPSARTLNAIVAIVWHWHVFAVSSRSRSSF